MKNFQYLIFAISLLGLVACGGNGSNDSDNNTPPIANAGPDQNVPTGSSVTLDGSSSSDADGDLLSFQWSFTTKPATSSATLSDATAVKPTFTADLAGTYILELAVDDGTVAVTSSPVTITATTTNSAPVADAGPDQNVATGSTVTLDASASSDADGDPLSYVWTFTDRPGGSAAALSDTTAASPHFTADLEGIYELSLMVNDGALDSAPDSLSITAATANSAPIANAGPDQNVATGSSVSLDGRSSSDADSDPMTYLWAMTSLPNGSGATLSDTTAAQPNFTADIAGTYVLSLVVNDGSLDSAPDNVTVTAAVNSVPVADAGTSLKIATLSSVALDGTASSDADSDSLTYSWSFTSRPDGSGAALTDTTDVQPSFTADVDGSYVVRLTVNDGLQDSAPDSVTLTAIPTSSGLPDTGQTRCWDSSGKLIDCAGSWQDGEFLINPMSFTDNSDGTVTDNLTGLTWQQADDGTKRTWTEADDYCTDLTLAGGGWRLPTVQELPLIADYGRNTPCADPVFSFADISDVDGFWTSTAFDSNQSWVVTFRVGEASSVWKTEYRRVRCVRPATP